MRNTLDTIQELSNLIKFSPKRKALFGRIRYNFDVGGVTLRPLCPTRWTVKAKSFESVIHNYKALQETLYSITTESDGVSNFEVTSKAGGIYSKMETFDLFFGLMVGDRFFHLTDSLSVALQGENVTATEAKRAAAATCKTIQRFRSDEEFSMFWERTVATAKDLQLSDPSIPRQRRPPRRIDSGSTPSTFNSPKEYYQKVYFEVADTINEEMKRRFEQKNYELYSKAEELLLSAAGSGVLLQENIDTVMKHFGEDLDHSRLTNQLAVLSDVVTGVNVSLKDVASNILSFTSTSSLFSEVLKLLQLMYVLPATTATAERSFSSLRRLKTYLRTTMSAQRLNHLMILHIHKDRTEMLDVKEIAVEFISRGERRKKVFGIM